MRKLTINLTDRQSEELDRHSKETGVTKNGLICLAVDEWLHQRKLREQQVKE